MAQSDLFDQTREESDSVLSYPRSWYALALSQEIRRGEIKSVRFLGQEYVLWRTEAGELAAMEPHCPHLGAHFAHGGNVVGEAIRCPMHHFQFGTDGACVAAGYGCQPRPKTRARTLDIVEQSGFVWTRHDPSQVDVDWPAPTPDFMPLGNVVQEQCTLALRPEQFVDRVARTSVESGARLLQARYVLPAANDRTYDLLVTSHGLGLHVIDSAIGPGDVRLRALVAVTPVGPNEIQVRVTTWIENSARSAVTSLLPKQFQRALLRHLTEPDVLVSRASQDPAIQAWKSRFLPSPEVPARPLTVLQDSRSCG